LVTIENQRWGAVTRTCDSARNAGVVGATARCQRTVAVEYDDRARAHVTRVNYLLGDVEFFGYVPAGEDQVAGDDYVSVKLASWIPLTVDSRPSVGEAIPRHPGGTLGSRVPLYSEGSVFAVSPDRRRAVCRATGLSINAYPGLTDSGNPGTEGLPQHSMAASRALTLAIYSHPGTAFTQDGCTVIRTDDRVFVESRHSNHLLLTELTEIPVTPPPASLPVESQGFRRSRLGRAGLVTIQRLPWKGLKLSLISFRMLLRLAASNSAGADETEYLTRLRRCAVTYTKGGR
jgi:hypothetical protein